MYATSGSIIWQAAGAMRAPVPTSDPVQHRQHGHCRRSDADDEKLACVDQQPCVVRVLLSSTVVRTGPGDERPSMLSKINKIARQASPAGVWAYDFEWGQVRFKVHSQKSSEKNWQSGLQVKKESGQLDRSNMHMILINQRKQLLYFYIVL